MMRKSVEHPTHGLVSVKTTKACYPYNFQIGLLYYPIEGNGKNSSSNQRLDIKSKQLQNFDALPKPDEIVKLFLRLISHFCAAFDLQESINFEAMRWAFFVGECLHEPR